MIPPFSDLPSGCGTFHDFWYLDNVNFQTKAFTIRSLHLPFSSSCSLLVFPWRCVFLIYLSSLISKCCFIMPPIFFFMLHIHETSQKNIRYQSSCCFQPACNKNQIRFTQEDSENNNKLSKLEAFLLERFSFANQSLKKCLLGKQFSNRAKIFSSSLVRLC